MARPEALREWAKALVLPDTLGGALQPWQPTLAARCAEVVQMAEFQRHVHWLAATHGRLIWPEEKYERTIHDFGSYLVEVTGGGLDNFSPIELVQPRYPGILHPLERVVLENLRRINKRLRNPEIVARALVLEAKTLPKHAGQSLLLPPRAMWAPLVCNATVAQAVRTHIKRPVKIPHAWRFRSYNQAVGGSEQSDHIRATGMDIDVPFGSRRKALKLLQGMFDSGLFEMGLGKRYKGGRIHLGIFTGKQRWW